MQELKDIVDQLRNALATKEQEIQQNGNSHTQGEIINCKNEIDFFEDCVKRVNASVFEKKQIIENFEKDANRIKASINAIKIT